MNSDFIASSIIFPILAYKQSLLFFISDLGDFIRLPKKDAKKWQRGRVYIQTIKVAVYFNTTIDLYRFYIFLFKCVVSLLSIEVNLLWALTGAIRHR